MMRIGIVTGEYPPMQGGVGAYSRIFAQTLAEQGHEVAVLTSTQARGDETVPVDNAIHRWGPGAIRQVAGWARERRLDVVNLQYQTAAFQMSPWIHFLPDLIQTPVVTTFHDLRFPYLFPKAGPLRPRIVRHLARASRGAIVTNHEDEIALRGLPNVALIPIGSNIDVQVPPDFVARDWRAGAGPGEFLIAYFGFANRSKGLETLLDALAMLRRDGIPARLVMIGGRTGTSDPTNAAYADEIDAHVERLGLAPFVEQTGYVSDSEVAAYLRAADAVALPFLDGASYRRGSLMAALQHGCAIVTTWPLVDIPAFRDGDNMLLVAPGDVSGLAAALRRLYDAPDLCARLRQSAAELAPLFDWAQIARDALAFFERVI